MSHYERLISINNILSTLRVSDSFDGMGPNEKTKKLCKNDFLVKKEGKLYCLFHNYVHII